MIQEIHQFENACNTGNLDIAKQYAISDHQRGEAFIMVCANGQLNIAKWLINGSTLSNDHFVKAVHYAVSNDQLDVVEWLQTIDAGILSNTSLFYLAVQKQSIQVANWFYVNAPDLYYLIVVNQAVYDYAILVSNKSRYQNKI
jgi:hypothetical protein